MNANPVGRVDPRGLFIAQSIGASIGVGFELYSQGFFSGNRNLDYKSIGLAGLTGALGGFAKRVVGASVRGAIGSVAMESSSQIKCTEFNSNQLLNAAKYGGIGGYFGGVGNLAGRTIQKSGGSGTINNIMFPELNTFRPVGNYGNHGSAIGGAVGGYYGVH